MKQLLHFTTAIVIAVVTFSCGGDDDNAISNQAPKITVQSFNVSEAAESTTTIATIVATDPDEDDLTFGISANDNDLFAITNTGALSIAEGKNLDFEIAASHAITVEVSDGDLTASAEITITVIDDNENMAPVIVAQSFETSEDISDAVAIGTVVATDDEPLTYSITTNSDDLFEITDVGVLSLVTGKGLDFDTVASHTITVEVSDGELTSSAEITINVTEKTSAPVILAQSFTVAEDILDTVEIGTVVATDDESLTYSIVTNSDDLFEITDAGVLSLVTGKGLDFETVTTHTITVEVSDGELTSSAEITINITNIIEAVVSTFVNSGFDFPYGVAVDGSGNIYMVDARHHRIRKITPSGGISTLAGGSQGFADGIGSAARFNFPADVAVDGSGNVYVADLNNHRIRKITPSGVVSTLAGGSQGFADGIGSVAQFDRPLGVAVDGSGNVYVGDTDNHSIRKITPAGEVSTVVGNGSQGFADGIGSAARFNFPADVAVDGSGNVYVSDTNNHRIRKITPVGEVSTVAGGSVGFANGTGSVAQFNSPRYVTTDGSGNLYVADGANHSIRKITPAGEVSTVAGNGSQGFVNGIGSDARFYFPHGMAIDGSGNIYIADSENDAIRKITFQ